jgi:hypothetical protein
MIVPAYVSSELVALAVPFSIATISIHDNLVGYAVGT